MRGVDDADVRDWVIAEPTSRDVEDHTLHLWNPLGGLSR